jgi:hypothetical protein
MVWYWHKNVAVSNHLDNSYKNHIILETKFKNGQMDNWAQGGTIHYREITQLNVLIIWCLYADFKHLGDQNHRKKSCYVASEFIALSLLVGIC